MLRTCFLLVALVSLFSLKSFGKSTVSGYVRDAASGEALIGANVIIEELGTGTTTNEYGYYALSLESGSYTLLFSYMGYATLSRSVILSDEMVLNMELSELLHELEEVTISSRRNNANITQLETGSTRLSIQSIRKIPALLGEVDVIKAIQLLPGVQVTSEGSSGFSVRGGGRDQNLILLDESAVYNASHLMGFFSIFNNDAIKDVKLYKGDIPARSGGRLASLLDIRMKEGNSKQFSASGGIGTISSRLTLEGPIVPDKVSFLLAGRRTYADLFLLFSKEEALRKTRLYFYDLNGKVNYRINDKNRIFLSGYSGEDIYANKEYAGMVFGNRTFTFRWNHIFNNNLFSNFTLVNSHYFYDLGTPEGSAEYFNWNSILDDYGFKGDFTWYPSPEHTVRFGASGIIHVIKPGVVSAVSTGGINQSMELTHNHSLENGLYLSGESTLGDNLSIRYGVRYSIFSNVGPTTVFHYDDDYNLVDSTYYEQGDFFNFYHGLEPRIAANYMLSEQHSVKASYSRTRQYLQLASNSTAGTPLEIWFPASPNIEPQLSDQVSVGYFRNFLDHKLQSSVELYYKKMNNSIDFRDHAQLMLNPRLDGELRIGEATSYGAELYLKYETREFSGWISYTYSRTMRDFPEINDGIPYPAPYDKPHDLAVVLSYDITPRIGMAANWIYSTGVPFTLPSGRYEVMGNIIPLYTGRNEYRFPDYHRLDLAVTIKGKERPGKRWRGEWNFSVYNAYARKNVWTLNFVQDESQPDVTYAEMTYLFSIVPAITYNFKF
ncbi:MAG: TonB-dependent receptor [Bacteroidales bacterium]|nr:TonB-dependent receptor [Bacteroidales bacterium]